MGILLTVNAQTMKPLTPDERRIIVDKGTEAPFTGKYYKHSERGLYRCRQCGAPRYRSEDKFDAGCGWPAFDDEIAGAVRRTPDADRERDCSPEMAGGYGLDGDGTTRMEDYRAVRGLR